LSLFALLPTRLKIQIPKDLLFFLISPLDVAEVKNITKFSSLYSRAIGAKSPKIEKPGMI